MSRLLKKSANFALDSVRGLDMYPKTIKLTYKGNEEFKTLLGGVVSLGIKVVILIYTWTMFSIMLSNKNSSKSINTSVKNLRRDNDIIDLQSSTFQFAVTGILNEDDIDIMNFEEAFTPEVRIITKLANETTFRNVTVGLCEHRILNLNSLKNEIETQDNYFAYKPGGKKSDIYEIRRIDNRFSIEDTESNNLLNVRFVKDPFTQSYDRGVITILDVIGNIGGLMGVFVVAGGFIVNLFSEKLFFYSIFSNMYKVEKPDNSPVIHATSLKIQNFENEKENQGIQLSLSEVSSDENFSKKDLSEKAKQAMLRRAKYDWKLTDLIYNTLGVFSVAFRCCLNKKNPLNIHQRLKLFEIAEQKYVKELDAVEFSKNMRNLNTLVASLLDKKEQLLVQHQKSNVLILDESDDGEKQLKDDFPKLFSKPETNGDYAIRITELMDDFNGNWDSKTYKLINGVCSLRSTQGQYSSLPQDNHGLFRRKTLNFSAQNSHKEIEEESKMNKDALQKTPEYISGKIQNPKILSVRYQDL